MKPITILQLKTERPEVRTYKVVNTCPSIDRRREYWVAYLHGADRKTSKDGPTEREALQSLANAMKWDVEVVEDARTVTVSELLKEHPEVVLTTKSWKLPAHYEACLGYKSFIHVAYAKSTVLQKLANAEGWNVKVVEDQEAADLDRSICEEAYNEASVIGVPQSSLYCTRCGKLIDGCVCEDGPKAILDQVGSAPEPPMLSMPQEVEDMHQSHPTPTPRTDAAESRLLEVIGLWQNRKIYTEDVRVEIMTWSRDARALERELNEAREKDSAALQLVKRLAEQEEILLSAPIGTVDIPDDLWAIVKEAGRIVGEPTVGTTDTSTP